MNRLERTRGMGTSEAALLAIAMCGELSAAQTERQLEQWGIRLSSNGITVSLSQMAQQDIVRRPRHGVYQLGLNAPAWARLIADAVTLSPELAARWWRELERG